MLKCIQIMIPFTIVLEGLRMLYIEKINKLAIKILSTKKNFIFLHKYLRYNYEVKSYKRCP